MPSIALFLWCGNKNDWCDHAQTPPKPRPPARPSFYPGENPLWRVCDCNLREYPTFCVCTPFLKFSFLCIVLMHSYNDILLYRETDRHTNSHIHTLIFSTEPCAYIQYHCVQCVISIHDIFLHFVYARAVLKIQYRAITHGFGHQYRDCNLYKFWMLKLKIIDCLPCWCTGNSCANKIGKASVSLKFYKTEIHRLIIIVRLH